MGWRLHSRTAWACRSRSARRILTSCNGSCSGPRLRSKTSRSAILRASVLSISDINISVRDFSRDQSCRLEFSAKLFGSARSRVRLGGQAGPFTSDSLPLSGMVTMALAPDEIPASLRHAEFGDLLAAPGKKAKVTLTATIRGDVYQRLSGPAKLVLTDVLIGKDAKHVLPLAGAAPVTFTATKLMSA